MERLSQRLQAFVTDRVEHARRPSMPPVRPVADGLTGEERRVYRTLKTEAERATKGRDVLPCVFEQVALAEGVRFVARVEGRDADGIARQVMRRFAAAAGCTAVLEHDQGRVVRVVLTVARKQG
jgi:hypothetical protein